MVFGVIILVTLVGLSVLIWWFPGPCAKIEEPINVGGDTVVMTIGNQYTLLDLHAISAMWASSGFGLIMLGTVLLGSDVYVYIALFHICITK